MPPALTDAEEKVGTTASTSSTPSTADTAECVITALVDASPVLVIVPPLSVSALAAIDAPLASTSPETTVYWNTRAVPASRRSRSRCGSHS